MKKTLLAMGVICSSLVANSSFATGTQGFYVGADLNLGNTTTVEFNGVSLSGDNDLGYTLNFGYDLPIVTNFVLAAEIDYRSYGNATILESEFSGSSYGLSLKPKFQFTHRPLYLALVLGLAKYSLEESSTTGSFPTESYSENGTKLGLELCYEFSSGIVANVGYSQQQLEINDFLDTKIHGFYLGGKYKF
jgi:opacity protein-like surface antigen